MAIGDNVKTIRDLKELTQAELAEKMNISRSYLSDIENNRKNPSSKTIESLAEKLNVSMIYLTTGQKTVKDLSHNDLKEQFKTAEGVLEQHNDIIKNEIKNDIKQLLDTELTFVEMTYLDNMLRFLKIADSKDIAGVASIMATLNRVIVYKNADDADRDELNEFLERELDDVTKFFHDFFFDDNKEGD